MLQKSKNLLTPFKLQLMEAQGSNSNWINSTATEKQRHGNMKMLKKNNYSAALKVLGVWKI